MAAMLNKSGNKVSRMNFGNIEMRKNQQRKLYAFPWEGRHTISRPLDTRGNKIIKSLILTYSTFQFASNYLMGAPLVKCNEVANCSSGRSLHGGYRRTPCSQFRLAKKFNV